MASTEHPIDVGDKIPSFQATDQSGNTFDVSNALGQKPLVIFFYPKDFTPVCTSEATSFRDNYEEFQKRGAMVVGVSADSAASHDSFAKQYNLQFPLLSDPDRSIRKKLGVPSAMMGMSDGRVTYIVDKDGTVKHIFNATFQGEAHVNKALEVLKQITPAAA